MRSRVGGRGGGEVEKSRRADVVLQLHRHNTAFPYSHLFLCPLAGTTGSATAGTTSMPFHACPAVFVDKNLNTHRGTGEEGDTSQEESSCVRAWAREWMAAQ